MYLISTHLYCFLTFDFGITLTDFKYFVKKIARKKIGTSRSKIGTPPFQLRYTDFRICRHDVVAVAAAVKVEVYDMRSCSFMCGARARASASTNNKT